MTYMFQIAASLPPGLLDEDFLTRRMAQETVRAGGEAVGTGLVDDHEVADCGLGQLHAVGQQVEWGAQWADDGGGFRFLRSHAVANGDRVVLADDLAEVAGGGKVLV